MMTVNKKGAGPPKKNTNAEKWTLKDAEELFDEALGMSLDEKYDFIGEIARDIGTYRELFVYLKKKFSKELGDKYKLLISNLEANCFSHIKDGSINTAAGIMNLKSNFKWTDRVETVNSNTNQNFNTDISKEEAKKINDMLENDF